MEGIIAEKGFYFSFDVGMAFVIMLSIAGIVFLTAVQLMELKQERIFSLERERAALFADSLIKRGWDENGLACVNLEKRAVEENILCIKGEKIKGLKNLFEENNVKKISIDKKIIFETGDCKADFAVERGVTHSGSFAVLKVVFCNE